jgi:hypothetical protein
MQTQTPQNTGTFKRGWLLIGASWRVLKGDRELLVFPALNMLFSIIIIGLFVLLGYLILRATGGDAQSFSQQYNDSDSLPAWAYPLIFVMLIPLFVVINYFTACVTAGALQRLRGKNPTISSSFQAADRVAGNIIIFSFFQGVVLWVIDSLRSIRFIGTALAFLGEMAFTVATFFVLPIIVDNPGKLGPLTATKQSTTIIKKIWGESIIVSTGMIGWAVLAGVAYTVIWGVLVMLVGPIFIHPSPEVTTKIYIEAAIVIAPLAIGYGVIIVIYSALSAVATTALYLYATENKIPAGFDDEALKKSIRAKTSSDL